MIKENSLVEIVERVVDHTMDEQKKAIALHDFVRENIKFGFNKYFDATPLDYLISCGFGHCNPKSHLMVALFRLAGLEAYQHFVAIPKEILKGAIPASQYWMIPSQVSHSYVEVRVGKKWYEIDSFIVDTPLLNAAKSKLNREGRQTGYGARVNSVNIWDGRSNAFSQFDKSILIEDHGRIDDLQKYFKDKRYRGVVMGVSFNTMFKIMGNLAVDPINANLEKIRNNIS